ncbi:MAG: hypothetical protein EOO46_00045 [Flavobacterium sp.]|nr:MAG: hypothetical protein EOO46_00045 [Flavobacterium sp.]
MYPTGELNRTFDITDAANSELIKITPFYSIQQDLWIFETFFEDTAHRLGIYFGGYCGRLIAVYCQPVYSKHHRCAQINTEILSLREFVNFAETGFIPLVSNQVRILQNNLCDPLIPKPPDLLHEILSPQQDFYQIDDYLLLEALSVSEPYSFGTYDIFYFLASSNLLNAWCSINRAKVLTNKQRRNLKQCYSFKSNISRFLAKTTSIDNPDVRIYCGDDLCIIEVLNFQFSFHGIALNRELKAYSKSNKNAVIEWKGKKLQPVAPLLMKYAISLIEN